MKKYIKTNKTKKSTKRIFVIAVVIPLIILYNVIFSFYAFKDLDNKKETIKFVNDDVYYTEELPMKGCIVYSLVIGIPISLLLFNWIMKVRKLNIKKAQFKSIKDIEYFRDKLSNITPTEISLLTDLEIEDKKDLTALLLKYYKMRIIEFDDNNKIKVLKIDDGLSDTDKKILEMIEQGLNDINKLKSTNWKQLVINESINGKYLKSNINNGIDGAGLLKTFVMLFVSLIIVFALLYNYGIEILEYLFYMIANLYKENGFINLCIVAIPAILIFISLFQTPILLIVDFSIERKNKATYKRTELGEEVTEYIYGLKNFIHDFSLLSEKDKEAIVLWDDFLIYAVLLEENDKIVNEIWNKSKTVPNKSLLCF